MLNKTIIRDTCKRFLAHRLSSCMGSYNYLVNPLRLEPFVHVAYAKLQELTALGHVPSVDHATRYIEDQVEIWGNRKLDNLLTRELKNKVNSTHSTPYPL